MAFTRAQAEGLLNKPEMALYDDSRINSLRGMSPADLAKRIDRARKARDRARDLLQRQTLATRDRAVGKRSATGDANLRSKRKAELLADILKRFEAQSSAAGEREKAAGKREKAAGKPASPARRGNSKPAESTGKSAAPSAPGKKAVGKPAKRATKQASGRRAIEDRKAAATAGAKAGKAEGSAKPISAKRALANTRKLLEAKQARERAGQPWQKLDPGQDHQPQAGSQSPRAAEQAEELHAGESRIPPIQGSISTRDRKHQGRRDRRG
ncbi:hypothetical protein [Luteimonas vadosa]|uniref:TolA protein n=1 Tax=Luteimonas vadosa TaxID=1165507 RepID=A0ABP9EA09_9GAMM